MSPASEKDRPARPEEVKGFRLVEDLAPELWQDVLDRGLAEAARSCGASVRGQRVELVFLGAAYVLDFERRRVEGPPEHRPPTFQTALVLLRYLAHGQDLGRSGRLVTARELNGGALFFTGPHALLASPVTERFGRDPEGFLAATAALGFTAASDGPYSCRGLALPQLELGCIFHPADDEFEAELTYTFDAYAHYHLPLDALWALINVLAEELSRLR